MGIRRLLILGSFLFLVIFTFGCSPEPVASEVEITR